MIYTVYWRFYGCTEWVAEEVWARSYADARSKILNSNHLIQVTEGYYGTGTTTRNSNGFSEHRES